jgi:FkbH-like protein
MKLTEILKRNRELGLTLKGKKYNIAIISNVTVNQLKEVLELMLREQGINAIVEIGDYNSIIQDSKRFSNANAVIVFWEVGNLIEGFADKVYSMSQVQLQSIQEKVQSEIDLVLRNLSTTSLVLMNYFSSLLFEPNSLRTGPLKNICNILNDTLRDKTGYNQILVDIDYILAKTGLSLSRDLRMYHSSKSLFTLDFFKNYSHAVAPAFKAATGNVKKIIVLDCDNTLWGGILGEEGEEGIQMNDITLNGKAYKEAQTILLGMQSEGVLLALCSKNNLSDVENVLNGHSDMILKEEHLVAKRVNWQDKASNLRELAINLNLGLDSFIFIDDSLFEIGLIQEQLPQVLCIQVPVNLSEYPTVIRELRKEFFSLSKTAEDDRKTEMYKLEQKRKNQTAQFNSTEEYLASLELKMNILWNEEIPVPRASQMTQKTNQFNFTTLRYTETDIRGMLNDSKFEIAVFSLEDKYGDYGISGIIIIETDPPNASASIDSFLMSCRIIGRNVEYAFFDILVQRLLNKGIKSLQAEYIPTSKNKQVENFYDFIGMQKIYEKENRKRYEMSLNLYKYQNISYISII